MSQDGAAVAGTWEEQQHESQGTLRGEISGQISGYVVSLRGSLYPVAALIAPVPLEPVPLTLADFNAQLSGAGTEASGSFVLVEHDATGRESMRLLNNILAMRRVK